MMTKGVNKGSEENEERVKRCSEWGEKDRNETHKEKERMFEAA